MRESISDPGVSDGAAPVAAPKPCAEEKPSRREQNKQATRAAIVNSAITLLSAKGPGHFTAEDLADAAGISRRTFFNYFPSPEAALAATVHDFLDGAFEHFQSRPNDESVLDSAIAAVTSMVDRKSLSDMARVCILTEHHAQQQRWQVMAWAEASEALVKAALERSGQTSDPFWVHTLVGSIIGAGNAAMMYWMSTVAPRDGELTSEQTDILRDMITQALYNVRNGFA